MQRRKFLKSSAIASTSLMLPTFLRGYQPEKLENSRFGKILVVVQLSGGNDGLNTIVPFRNDLYYQNRPTLALGKQEILTVSDDLAFHKSMNGLKELYEEGYLTIVNNVGYPNPDRSHFRSMDIWQTGSGSQDYWKTGWLGRYLDHSCTGCDQPYTAIDVDDTVSLALKGKSKSGFAMGDPRQLRRTTSNPYLKAIGRQYQHSGDHNLNYLYKTMIETQASASYLVEQSNIHRSSTEYPSSAFGKDLKQISELITADTDTRIYYASLTGFDTHANQKNQHARLLQQFSDGIKAFMDDLKQNGLINDVLVLAFSEFGRRVKQNASNGTDHGAANNLYILNGRLKKAGFYNAGPDLSNLLNGDVRYEVDFRRVYATILENWLEADPHPLLRGYYQKLTFI